MTSPVQLSDLDPASVANDADLALIRKNNTTDYKVTVQLLRNINVAGLPDLSPTANSPDNSDLLIVARAGVNCKCLFPSIGFPIGTKLWFYQDAVPVSTTYWAIVPGTGDRLLAVKGGASYTTGGTVNAAANWQQSGATLTINQIPNHTHNIICGKDTENTKITHTKGTRNDNPSPRPRAPTEGITGATTDVGTNQCLPHNHGNTWRPAGAIGIICQKQL